MFQFDLKEEIIYEDEIIKKCNIAYCGYTPE